MLTRYLITGAVVFAAFHLVAEDRGSQASAAGARPACAAKACARQVEPARLGPNATTLENRETADAVDARQR